MWLLHWLLIIAAILAAIKLYLKLTTGWNTSAISLVGKTAIITGANTGIGFETALEFAKRGARVILACRNREKAEEARRKIIVLTENENLVVKIIDLASLSSVRAFAEDINKTEPRLNILVNNAGAGLVGNKISIDGLQLVMQVNHFSNFLLTNLLIGLLKKSAPSRIVNVSSMASKWANLDPVNLNKYPRSMLSELVNYSNSKVCNILFTNELARSLQGSGVTANSLHPGVILTELHRRVREPFKSFYESLGRIFLKTPEEGAQTTIFLSVSKEVEDISGFYFAECRKEEMTELAKDVGVAKKVWEESERLVRLSTDVWHL